MSTAMIGWFGDANGYIGDPDLKPETAHTFSATYSQTSSNKDWQVSANFWYSAVNNYIDAKVIDSFNSGSNDAGIRNVLQLTNVDATLYGAKLRSTVQVADSEQWGQWQVAANLTTTHGERDASDEKLYQIIPLQTEVTLQHQSGNWQNSIVWQWVDSKRDVDTSRLENTTDSYHLLNLESKLTWQKLTLSLGLNNAFDRYYELPMGGVSIAQFKMDSSQGFNQLAGAGRSVNLGVSYAF
jgi:iron complex outermembrane receptor protein